MLKLIYKYWKVVVVLILTFHLLLLSKLKFTAWPEMLLWPYLLLHGLMPYRDVAIVHTPILILKLAAFYKIFGVGVLQLKVFTWLVIIFTDILVFAVAKKIWKRKVAIFSLCVYVILQLFYDGNGLWFDLLLAPLALITFYLTVSKEYFLAGIAFALMFLTKQTAVWFLFPILFQLWVRDKKKITSFVKGNGLVFFVFIIIFFAWNMVPSFYNWAINFGMFVLPRSSGQIHLPDIKNLIISLFPFSIFIPLLLIKKMKLKNLAMWSGAGIMGAYPRYEYFHFQPGIAFLAFGTGIFFVTFNKKDILSKILIPIYILGCFYLSFSFVIRNYNEGVRFYEANVQEVVQYVKNNTIPGDKIFVLNWWDNIYPLTDTIPGIKPWVPQLSWYQEIPGIQEKEVADLILSKPKLILFQEYTETGLSSYKPLKLYGYVMANYKLKEKIDGIEVLIPK